MKCRRRACIIKFPYIKIWGNTNVCSDYRKIILLSILLNTYSEEDGELGRKGIFFNEGYKVCLRVKKGVSEYLKEKRFGCQASKENGPG